MVVVVVQPTVELAPAFGLGCVATGVRPAISKGPVESLDLPVGLRPIWPGALVLDAALVAGIPPKV